MLPDELLDCFQDIVELQATASKKSRDSPINHEELSNMQASIESRLAPKPGVCKRADLIADCCRIAGLITCFLSFTDIWANALIPCRLSDLLRVRLQDSITDLDWIGRRDLQLWLLFTGSTVTTLGNGHMDGLDREWNDLLDSFHMQFTRLPRSEINKSHVESALNDFIYCDVLVERRSRIPAWSALEQSIIGS